MHVMYSIGFAAIDRASKIWTFLKTNYLKFQAVSKGFQVSNFKYLIEPSPNNMSWNNHIT